MWCITQVNYHTLINPPHIPSNAISRAMSVLFSALNTDKPILRAWHSNRVGRSVSHSDSIWGERTSQREQSNSRNWMMHWGWECILPFLTRGPYFFPYGGPPEVGGICPGRHSGPPPTSAQILTPPLRMYPGQAGAWVSPTASPSFSWVSSHPPTSQSNFSQWTAIG